MQEDERAGERMADRCIGAVQGCSLLLFVLAVTGKLSYRDVQDILFVVAVVGLVLWGSVLLVHYGMRRRHP